MSTHPSRYQSEGLNGSYGPFVPSPNLTAEQNAQLFELLQLREGARMGEVNFIGDSSAFHQTPQRPSAPVAPPTNSQGPQSFYGSCGQPSLPRFGDEASTMHGRDETELRCQRFRPPTKPSIDDGA